MQKVIGYKKVVIIQKGKMITVRRAIWHDMGKGGTDKKYKTRLETEIYNLRSGRIIA